MQVRGNIWRLLGGFTVLGMAFAGIWLLARPHASTPIAAGKIQIVAAENFWGDIAAQIGGNHVHVTSIINDVSTDPHLYESNAQNASIVESAQIVIVNGMGYDDFMTKLLAAASDGGQQVLTVSHILHTSEGANQHLWYDIPHIHLVAESITNTLIASDPSHSRDYRENLAAFNASLGSLQKILSTIHDRYPDAPIAYTEPVAGYLLTAAGLQIRTPEGFAKSIEDGNDPSPADTQTLENLLVRRQVKVLLYNAQATSPVTEHIKEVARHNGIPVLGFTETLPVHTSYQTWQHQQLNQLLRTLEESVQ